MKKKIIAAMAACAILAAAGCNNNTQTTTTTAAELTTTTTAAETTTEAATEAATDAVTEEANTTSAAETDAPAASGVMSHDEYDAAEIDSEVTVETYVQAKQSWWEDETGVGQASFYAQNNPEGGYFFYNMPCSEEDYNKIVPGTKVRVTGYKSVWGGEIEITDASFEIIDGDTFTAAAEDVTALLGTDDLIKHMNEFVSFKGMTVEKIEAKDEKGNVLEEGAVFYKWNNSGTEGDDLYFNVSKDGVTYTFTVESYLCGKETQVYKDVQALNIGDTIDLEGFLYWYESGLNPHITSITKA